MITKNEAPAAHGFRNDEDAERFLNEKAWRAECAKVGKTEAASVTQIGGSSEQIHAQRKLVRQAINAMTQSQNDGSQKYDEVTEDQMRASSHAALMVARADEMIEGLEGQPSKGGESGWRNSQGKPVKAMFNEADYRAHYLKSDALGQDMSIGDFFRGVGNMPTTQAVKNALSVGTNTSGGFTVPSVLMPLILGALVPNSSLLQAGMPIVPLEEVHGKNYTTAVLSAVPTAAWRAEAGSVAESDPAFTGVVATPQSLSFYVQLSRELFADSVNLVPALLLAIGQAMAVALDLAGLRGSGTAPTPRGILNTSGIQAVTNGANGTSLVSYANLFSALQALLQANAPTPGAAIMSPRSLVKLGGLADSTGQPLRVPSMLEPVKLLTTSQIPNNLTVGTSSDCSEIYLGDFTKMALMLREGLSVQPLSELFAGTGQLAFMCHCRADFSIFYPAAFALVTGVRP